ncbi:MAG: acyl carrier protein [Bdellovibrionales bacterium GWA2_49_15]|nr:MAG: acyl carrier protein [Bdellovibrionales bacterium GWA2_49_15]
METNSKLQELFRDIFDDDSIVLKPETCANDIEDWDSLMHINLIVAIEKEWGIKFALGELSNLKNVKDMLVLIESKSKN